MSLCAQRTRLSRFQSRGVLRLPAGVRCLASPASAPSSSPAIDFDNLKFGLTETDSMFVAHFDAQDPRGSSWRGGLEPYGDLRVHPSAAVLNYGQGCFEGLKAFTTAKGRVVTFRPYENARRMASGAVELAMPPVPEEFFVDAVRQVVRANLRFVPPEGKGALYVRPLLIGTGPVLGLAPAPSFTFLVYVSPVGAYFKGGKLTPISLLVEEGRCRAAPGGVGDVKYIGNYSQTLRCQLPAKKQGFADVVYLDASDSELIEEVSSCDIFAVRGRQIITPRLGSILPGITRASVIEIARARGYEVMEAPLRIGDVLSSDEVFCTGTAVVVSPVGSLTYKGVRHEFQNGNVGKVSQEIYTALTDMQHERAEDSFGWLDEIQS